MIIERAHPDKIDFLREYRELCHRHGMMLWADSEMGDIYLDGVDEHRIDAEVDSIRL